MVMVSLIRATKDSWKIWGKTEAKFLNENKNNIKNPVVFQLQNFKTEICKF